MKHPSAFLEPPLATCGGELTHQKQKPSDRSVPREDSVRATNIGGVVGRNTPLALVMMLRQ